MAYTKETLDTHPHVRTLNQCDEDELTHSVIVKAYVARDAVYVENIANHFEWMMRKLAISETESNRHDVLSYIAKYGNTLSDVEEFYNHLTQGELMVLGF